MPVATYRVPGSHWGGRTIHPGGGDAYIMLIRFDAGRERPSGQVGPFGRRSREWMRHALAEHAQTVDKAIEHEMFESGTLKPGCSSAVLSLDAYAETVADPILDALLS